MVKGDNIRFCFRCYHYWKKRKPEPPKSCPKCRSPYWNRPRKRISKGMILKMKEMTIQIHDRIIKISGGELGVRDEGGIHNSISKLLNHQYKNQREPIKIGAFTLNEFSKRHYFTDGNKRTSYAIAKIFMLINRCHLMIDYGEARIFMVKMASYKSKVTYGEIKSWLQDNCKIIEEEDVTNYLNQAFVNVTLGGVKNNE